MAVLPIRRYPDPVLRILTKEWVWETDNDLVGVSLMALRRYAEDMTDTLRESDRGAALAANQIGIEYRMFVIEPTLAARNGLPTLIVNPTIVEKGGVEVSDYEGCLSFPGVHFKVSRSQAVTARFSSEDKTHEVKLENFIARVFQHEIDHLEGKLFIDELSTFKRKEVLKKMGVSGA